MKVRAVLSQPNQPSSLIYSFGLCKLREKPPILKYSFPGKKSCTPVRGGPSLFSGGGGGGVTFCSRL